MLIAHIADLHLGYRAYHRITPGGGNVREADVARAFRAAVEAMVRVRPDLVVIAGDLFHTVRPSNTAIADAFRQLASLSGLLPGVPIVLIAGNHDSPRSADTGNILCLFGEIEGVEVVTEAVERVRLRRLAATVTCVPHNALVRSESPALEPDPAAEHNVLVVHGTVTGDSAARKIRYLSEFGGVSIDESVIAPERWDYVALGHYHIATELAPNMWYSGGTERTSSNIWSESGEKGFVVYDTERRVGTFEPIPTRPVVDLPRVGAAGLTAAEVDAEIARRVGSIAGGIAGKIVRLVVTDIPRHVLRELDHRRIREYKADALHFQLDARPPEVRRATRLEASATRRPLAEQVSDFLGAVWTPSSSDIRPERLVELGRTYLEAVGEDG